MTEDELTALFEKHDEKFLDDDAMITMPSQRRDLRAFILLDKLVPGKPDMVCHAEHDEIWLEPSLEDLADSEITEEDVITLIRCGVRISDGGLAMFV